MRRPHCPPPCPYTTLFRSLFDAATPPTLTAAATTILNQYAAFLQSNPGVKVELIGHTDQLDLHAGVALQERGVLVEEDRKSTRLNSSHLGISYAVFCLKQK